MKWVIIGAVICALICLFSIWGHAPDPVWYDMPTAKEETNDDN